MCFRTYRNLTILSTPEGIKLLTPFIEWLYARRSLLFHINIPFSVTRLAVNRVFENTDVFGFNTCLAATLQSRYIEYICISAYRAWHLDLRRHYIIILCVEMSCSFWVNRTLNESSH